MVVYRGGTPGEKVKAPAKINVGLHILGVRPDGYHEIWTILQQINLADELLLLDTPDFSLSLTCNRPDIPVNEDNLCLKAARLLQRETGCRKGVKIHLHKNIPVGAGLGGGSSDAAATLTALNQMWGTGLGKAKLRTLAEKLGSDVPFFLEGGCCIASGRGEVLKKIDRVIKNPMVLVCPNIQISTSWAYKNIKNYRLTSKKENIIFQSSFKKDISDPQIRNILSNDFETPVFEHYPTLKEIKETLLECGAYYASLSGSGSSVYAAFYSSEEARTASQRIHVEGSVHYLE